MRLPLGWATCVVALFLIAPLQAAHAVTVVPSRGTFSTHFVAYESVAAGPPPAQYWVELDGDRLRGQSGSDVPIFFPAALDTMCSSANGCNAATRSLGTHTLTVAGFNSHDEYYEHNFVYSVLAHDPVLLVHGICGDSSSWDTFGQILSDSAFAVARVQYGTHSFSDPPKSYVGVLAANIDAMDCDRVAIVAHSMGGLIARSYMQRELAIGHGPRVSQLVTMGTPHHGTDTAAKLLKASTNGDILCSILFPGVPCHLAEPLGCQGDAQSTRALKDMSPGSTYLNELNYGTQAGNYDPSLSNGWDSHAAETLPTDVYFASIAGTKTSCFQTWRYTWGSGSGYHPNDGVVATGSSLLSSSSTFRALDSQLPTAQVTHANTPPVLCEVPYYSLSALGQKVARILRTSPSSPPALVKRDWFSEQSLVAVAEDSLRMMPAIVDTIAPGAIDLPTRTIPATSLMLVTLLSDDARLTLRAPNGTTITPNDTSTVNGIAYFGDTGSGFEGYRIEGPQSGSWTFQVAATGSAAVQHYACIVEYPSALEAKLSARLPVIYSGDSIRVRAEMDAAGLRQLGIAWTCRVIGPNGATLSLALLDDGAHGDSLVADGIYGVAAAPFDGVGLYRLGAYGTYLGQTFMGTADCELAYFDDLSVSAADIGALPNLFNGGDSVTVTAKVRNNGSRNASGVRVDVRDRRTDVRIGSTTVTIPAGGTVTIQMPWRTALPDTHEIEVVVSPYVFEEEVTYANNRAAKVVVFGKPVGVDPDLPAARDLELEQPLPNPSGHSVSFVFRVSRQGPAVLELYDVLGRRMRRWFWSDLAAGAHSLKWDGSGEAGQRVAPGVLVCRLTSGHETRSRKLVFRP